MVEKLLRVGRADFLHEVRNLESRVMGYFHTRVVVVILFSSEAEWCLTAKMGSDESGKVSAKTMSAVQVWLCLEATSDIFISFPPLPNPNLSPILGDCGVC